MLAMRCAVLLLALFFAACGNDELRLVNRLDQALALDLHGPRVDLTGGCDQDFRARFCAEEFVPLGVVNIGNLEDRVITVFDESDDERCTNLLWIRVLSLGEVGPVREPGTLFRLPAVIEVEEGAGKLHSAAFPQATIRVDEVGNLDENQGTEPPACADLGRAPR